MQLFNSIFALALAAAVLASPAPKISQADLDKIEENASKPIGQVVAEETAGLTAADCAGSTSNACILAGFSDDPSQ